MKMEQIKEIANAVLYEGYLLYPYRRSAIKNRQRWTIGVVYPRDYSQANGSSEPWFTRTECLIAGQSATLTIHVRFLHLLLCTDTAPAEPPAGEWHIASHLAYEPYEEGIEREITLQDCPLRDLCAKQRVIEITFPQQRLTEDATGTREQQAIAGAVLLSAEQVDEDLYKLCVQIENRTPGTATLSNRQNSALLQSFIAAHSLLRVHEGNFISLLEPPEELQALAQSCQNRHTWPVLIGDEGESDTLLSSPIILYDYPQIAPESPGPLFDGTEIDEILTLRILTLTDEEKEEMRRGDTRVREILERTEALTPEQFMKLHGTIRGMRPID